MKNILLIVYKNTLRSFVSSTVEWRVTFFGYHFFRPFPHENEDGIMFPFAPTFMLGGGDEADAEASPAGPPGAQRAVGLRFFSRTFFSRLVMMSTAELRMASFVQGLAFASSLVLVSSKA